MKWLDKMHGSYKDTVAPETREKQRTAMKQLQVEGKLPLSSSAIELRVKENDLVEIAAKEREARDKVAKNTNRTASGFAASQQNFYASMAQSYYNMPSSIWGAGISTEQRKPLEPELTVIEPVTGWRRWSVEMFGNELRSNNGIRWTPYEKLTAECKQVTQVYDVLLGRPTEVKCKGVHCTCGIYAYKTPEDAKFGENAPRNLSTGSVDCWGEVYLWGRVIEHSKGWRAQFAYPKSFVDSGIARQLATVYGCKVVQDTWEAKPQAQATPIGTAPHSCSCATTLGHVVHRLPDGSMYRTCTHCLWQEIVSPISMQSSKLFSGGNPYIAYI